MNDDNSELWLRERMQAIHERRKASAMSFEHIWSAAREERSSLAKGPAWPFWRTSAASFATVLLTTTIFFQSVAQRKQTRQKESEFAAVNGVLMTYWQAPSDDLFTVGDTPASPNRDE